MLVLSRKDGEEILIGDDIVIRVTAIKGGRVAIGIDAPESVRIMRGELCEKSKLSLMQAGQPGTCGTKPMESCCQAGPLAGLVASTRSVTPCVGHSLRVD